MFYSYLSVGIAIVYKESFKNYRMWILILIHESWMWIVIRIATKTNRLSFGPRFILQKFRQNPLIIS